MGPHQPAQQRSCLDWRAEPIARTLAQAIVLDPEFEALRTEAVRAFLSSFAPGGRVWIFGCGALSARLASSGGIRPDLDVAFLETTPAEPLFHGHPRLSPAQALLLPAPDAIVLATGAYAEAMRGALGALGARALALDEILRTEAAAPVMAEAWRRVSDLAEEVRAALTCGNDPERSVLFLGHISIGRPHFFRTLGPRWQPRLLAQNVADESDLERLRGEGALEYVNLRRQHNVFVLVAACLLTGSGFASVVAVYEHSLFLPVLRLAASKRCCALVLWISNMFLQICSIPSRMHYFETLLGLDTARLVQLELELLRAPDAVVTCYSPDFIDVQRRAHNLSFASLRANKAIDTETEFDLARALPLVEAGQPVELVLSKSIYTRMDDFEERSKRDCAWNDRDIRFFSNALKNQSVRLTVFNCLDTGQDCFASLRAYAASRRNLVYRLRVSESACFRELEHFAFGWLVKPVAKSKRDFFRQQIPDTVFTYLRCGLPIIVSEHLAAASEFVQAYGIGFSIRTDQLDQVETLCRTFDREAYAVRRREALAQMGSAAFGQRLSGFLDSLPRWCSPWT